MLLQGLVHAKILRGVRGPRGGYELARERRRITVGEIVRTAMSLNTADPEDLGSNSVLLERVIDPAVREGGRNLSRQSGCDHRRTDVRDGREVACARRREGQRRFCYLIPVFARLARRHGPLGSRRRQPQNHVAVALAGVQDFYDPVAQIAIERDPQLPAPALGRREFIDPGSQGVIGTSCLLAR